jgi:adenylosuccinate synthase
MNILGNGVALDPENLMTEIEEVRSKGVSITPENLMISDRASLLVPWHRDMDELEEMRLKDKKYGSTKQGIAPFYSDKHQKKTVLAGELFYPEKLMAHLIDIMEWKNLTLELVYGYKPYTLEQIEEERRIFYVGMTRAKKTLELHYLTGTKEHPKFPSRFIDVLLK